MSVKIDVLATAQAAHRAHVTVIPVREDGSKAPDLPSWKQFQIERPTPAQMREWFGGDRPRAGIGVVCGPAGLQGMDFDEHGIWTKYRAACVAAGLGPLIERVESGYGEDTPNGHHVLFYCSAIGSNTKLAQRPKRPEEMKDEHDRVKTIIETREQGGYFIIAPSSGGVHETGRPYVLTSGAIDSIKTISPEKREALFEIARTFDRMPRTERQQPARPAGPSNGQRPGDAFNARAEWGDLLEPAGWVFVHARGDEQYWRRPGKRIGTSATTGYKGSDLFYCFTTSAAPFENDTSYSKFAVYAWLHHDSDYAAAATALAAEGYGTDGRQPTPAVKATSKNVPSPKDRAPIVAHGDSPGADLRWRTARDIAAETPERPDWIVERLLAHGAVTELSAKVKVGKTTLLGNMIASILGGVPFLALATAYTPIVLLTEERTPTLRAVLERVGLLEADDLHILLRQDSGGLDWPEVIAAATKHTRAVQAGVLAVDTLSDWANIAGDEENSAGAALTAMRPLHEAAGDGLAVWVNRHDRKSGGDLGDSARGSSAFSGASDIILSLRRANTPGHESRRELLGVGRFDGVPERLMLELDHGQYVSLGDQLQVERVETRAALLDMLPDAGGTRLGEADILERLEKGSRGTLRRVLEELVDGGQITKEPGLGKTRRAFGYALANEVITLTMDPDQSHNEHVSESDVRMDVSSPLPPDLNAVISPLPLSDQIDGHVEAL